MARRSKFSFLFSLFIFAALCCGGYFLFQDMNSPEIVFSHTAETISPTLPLTVTVTDSTSAIKKVSVLVRFKENEIPVVSETFNDGSQTQQVTFSLNEAGLKHNDTFDLEITALDSSFGGFGFGNKGHVILPLRLDAMPPRTAVKTSIPYVRRGGTGCILYSIAKEVQQTGVKVGELFFPAFRQETGDYLCFFGFPHYIATAEFKPLLVALDLAGNLQSTELQVTAVTRQFKADTISVSQSFLDAKAVEFEKIFPGPMTDIERFLKINGQVRRENAGSLLEIGKNTAREMLWSGAFLRLPRAASRAGFADHRTYLWEGQKVDEQVHLGFDLASTRQAPVPAANSGTVVFAGYLGIYGNLIVIDHGLGLQSLYSHLSEIAVSIGQNVAKGDSIGKTGATGMAGGDHLHFGIVVSGLEVTPLEWLDDHWIKDNIVDRIKDAGGSAPEFNITPSQPQQKPQPARKPATRPAAGRR